jgi:hypothetical protein
MISVIAMAALITFLQINYPHEVLIYTEDDGSQTKHYLPRDTIYDENGYIRSGIYEIYGW